MSDVNRTGPRRSGHPKATGSGNLVDVWIAFAACLGFLGMMGLLGFLASTGPLGDGALCLLAGGVGAAFGWVAGIVLSPYDVEEERTFKGASKAIYGLITGYLIAKLDPLISAWIAAAAVAGPSARAVLLTGIGFTCFLAVAAATYVSRRYWL